VEKRIKSAVGNKMDSKLYEVVADISIRLASLEDLLMEKGVITKEDYSKSVKDSAKKFAVVAEKILSERKDKNTILQ